ncbi:MAG: hypothetical protein P4L49_12405 [Desulfosporosinus sp.]|nr:hypothetical protein [Desulfosporosinus sp.]
MLNDYLVKPLSFLRKVLAETGGDITHEYSTSLLSFAANQL